MAAAPVPVCDEGVGVLWRLVVLTPSPVDEVCPFVRRRPGVQVLFPAAGLAQVDP